MQEQEVARFETSIFWDNNGEVTNKIQRRHVDQRGLESKYKLLLRREPKISRASASSYMSGKSEQPEETTGRISRVS